MVKVKLRGVDSRVCAKPKCETGSHTLNRHHKKHQAMWLGLWRSRRKGEPEWSEFIKRYWMFHPDDIVLVCVSHHAEIHVIYDRIIQQDIEATGKPLNKYTWDEANRLMNKLAAACDKWIKTQTPGINSELYGNFRDRRRALKLKENAEAAREARKRKKN